MINTRIRVITKGGIVRYAMKNFIPIGFHGDGWHDFGAMSGRMLKVIQLTIRHRYPNPWLQSNNKGPLLITLTAKGFFKGRQVAFKLPLPYRLVAFLQESLALGRRLLGPEGIFITCGLTGQREMKIPR